MNTYLFRRSKKRFPRKVIAEAHTYIHIQYTYGTYLTHTRLHASGKASHFLRVSPMLEVWIDPKSAKKKHDDKGLRDNSTHLIYDNSSQIALSLSSLHDITSPSLARRSHDHITSSFKAHFISSPSARLV